MMTDIDDMTFPECQDLINQYVFKINEYLRTQKMEMKPQLYMKVYTAFVKMCDENDKAPELYQLYKQILDNYINQEILPSINNKVGDSAALLKDYVFQWKQFNLFTCSMKKMFDYLDRYYLKNGNHMENLA